MNTKTQLLRFLVVGGFSGVLDLSCTLLCQYKFGWTPWAAKALGFIIGTATAFAINRVWTFDAKVSVKNISSVVALYCVTFVIQELIYSALSYVLPHIKIFSILIYCIAQSIATIVNFTVQKYVIFKSSATSSSSASLTTADL